MTKVTENLLRE